MPPTLSKTVAQIVADLKKNEVLRQKTLDLNVDNPARLPKLRKLFDERAKLLGPVMPLFAQRLRISASRDVLDRG